MTHKRCGRIWRTASSFVRVDDAYLFGNEPYCVSPTDVDNLEERDTEIL
jgi:hypothetical protein